MDRAIPRHQLLITRGVATLMRLRKFCKDHNHSVVAVKVDSYADSFYLIRSDKDKNAPVKMVKTGDVLSMVEKREKINEYAFSSETYWDNYIS